MLNRNIFLHDDLEELFKSYYSISAMVRKEGILSLENVINTVESVPVLFKIGTELICSGYDNEKIRRILDRVVYNTEMSSEDRKTADAMIVGLLSIRNGDEPSKTMLKMAKTFGGIKIFKYAGIKSSEEPTSLILFGESFDLSTSSPYQSQSLSSQEFSSIDPPYEKLIVSFLNCNELARREGLYKVHEVLSNAPDAPKELSEILEIAVRDKAFDMLPKIVEQVLSKSKVETRDEALIHEGIQVLFEGVHNRYLLSSMASLFGLQNYYDVMALGEVNRFGWSYYFGASYTRPVQKTASVPREEAIVYRNWGEVAKDYEDFDLCLSVAALSELMTQYEAIDDIIPFSISVELTASAIHVLDSEYLSDVFSHKADSEAYNQLKLAYEQDKNMKDVHVKNANYLADLMMGGDGESYR